jgi:hypothetical protein
MTAEKNRRNGFLRNAYTALGIVSLFLGITSTGWLVLMVKQWALPWSSLSAMAPPGAPPPADVLMK